MKGFKDSSGKFHPITEYKGVRKSRDQTVKTKGVRIRKQRDPKYSVDLDDLVKDFPDMMQEIAKQKGCDYTNGKFIKDGFNMETVCGASTSRIYMKLLKIKPIVEGGVYQGNGLMDKEPNRGHQWIRLDDGTIVDGSFGQFLNKKNVTPQDRLKIIPPNDPRQDDYVGLYEENPFTKKQKYYTELTAKLKTTQRTK